jgi:hypothetical protein
MWDELGIAFGIVAVCVMIHTLGIVILGERLVRYREEPNHRHGTATHALILALVFAIIIVLHLVETAIWAIFYRAWGLFGDFETSFYFSLITYATIGYGDVVLSEKWRLLGGIEGLTGVLLSGLSTAFIFVVLSSLFQFRTQRKMGTDQT